MKKLLAVLLAFWSIASHADVITFRFTGTVSYATYMALPGDQIRGTFTYDTSIQPYFKGHPMMYIYSDPRPEVGFSAQVGQHRIDGRGLSLQVNNNFGNRGLNDASDGLIFSGGYPVVIDGTTYPSGSIGMVLLTTPGESTAISGFHLPRTINVADYPNRYGTLQTDGGPNDQLLQFTIDSIEVEAVVPGPR